MKLSISNIAWAPQNDMQMYPYFSGNGFSGVEIAPTRTFSGYPDCGEETVKQFSAMLLGRFGLTVSSIQSILFGKTERLFGSESERLQLSAYIKKVMDYAVVLSCGNLVFGSPKNRVISSENQYPVAIRFFKELSGYAEKRGTVLSIEPNPVIYGTNFINNTKQAFELVKEVNHPCFRVNVDLGTVIQNGESLKTIEENMALVNHVHISEPNLEPIAERKLHRELADMLKQNGYSHFVSIEMKECGNIEQIQAIVQYILGVFGIDTC